MIQLQKAFQLKAAVKNASSAIFFQSFKVTQMFDQVSRDTILRGFLLLIFTLVYSHLIFTPDVSLAILLGRHLAQALAARRGLAARRASCERPQWDI